MLTSTVGKGLLAFQKYHDRHSEPYDLTGGLTVKEIEQAPHNFNVQCLGEGLCCKYKRIQPFAREHRGDQATEIRYPNHRISFIRARRSYRSNLRVFRAALFVRVKDGEEAGEIYEHP